MRITKRYTRSVLLGAAMLLVAACDHEDLSGEKLAQEKGCVACHGMNGVSSVPIYPNLSGQWDRYLRSQLRAYRSGKRENSIMQGMAASLTDAEISALAEHYGR